jgi:hypothetical protein
MMPDNFNPEEAELSAYSDSFSGYFNHPTSF